ADITGGVLNHIGAAVLWFAPTMTATATSGASNVDITLNGNHFGTLKSTDPIVCAANGQVLAVEGADPAPSCHVDEAVRVLNGTRLIGAALTATHGHGQWSTSVHIPARSVGATYAVTGKGVLSNLTKVITYHVTS